MHSWTSLSYLLVLLMVVDHVDRSFQAVKPNCVPKPGTTWCDEVDNYPEAEISKLLQNSEKEFMFDDTDPKRIAIGLVEDTKDTLCMAEKIVTTPKVGTNTKKQQVFIINDVNHTQSVISFRCLNPGKTCNLLEGRISEDASYCVQRTSKRRLHVYKQDDPSPSIATDTFEFPSCCVCYRRRGKTFGR